MKNKFTKTVLMAVAVLGLFVTFTGKVQAAVIYPKPMIGQIMFTAFGTLDKGWYVPCNGQLLKIKNYQTLFSLIGITYGGVEKRGGSFGVPDMRGRVPVMMGQGPGLSKYVLGETGGAKEVKLVKENMTAHTHTATATSKTTVSGSIVKATLNAYNGAATKKTAKGNSLSSNTGGNAIYSDQSPNVAMKAGSASVDIRGLTVDTKTDVTVKSFGTSTSHGFSIMQPSIEIVCVIAYEGYYPYQP